ncbi:MAG: LamG domain-containing protein [Saprospiraceae bacterium]|nr:LamG domain-containing protein [Saprospiraceae bacterium]
MNKFQIVPNLLLVITILFLIPSEGWSQNKQEVTGFRTSPVSYHLSFDDDAFFTEDIIEQSGKKSLDDRKIDFPPGKFGNGIRMKEIPQTPDVNNMTGIDLDLVTAVIFNTHPDNQMGFNQPFIWGSGRINARLGAVAFWARGTLPFAGPIFEQTSVGFGRKERDLLGITVDEANVLSAYIRDSRYVTQRIESTEVWNSTEWNHVTFNWDWANGMELWINGNLIASSWGQQAWFETALPGLFHLPAAGLIYDEFYIFDRPITQKEIKALIFSNTAPGEEPILYQREITRETIVGEISGASFTKQLPIIDPDHAAQITEAWPQEVSDEHVPGWFVVDGRNEIAWPHPYSMFTIIPGDADFHAEKVDLKMNLGSKVNYVTLTGNLTNVSLQASTPRQLQMLDLFQVPDGKEFFTDPPFHCKRMPLLEFRLLRVSVHPKVFPETLIYRFRVKSVFKILDYITTNLR